MKSKPNEERRNAARQADDLNAAKEGWKNGEVAPSANTPSVPQTRPLARVADAGDIGAGTPSVYETDVAADVVGAQSTDAEKIEQEAVTARAGNCDAS